MKSRRGSVGLFSRPGRGQTKYRQFEVLEERWLFSASPAELNLSPSEPELATIAEVATPWDAPIAAGSTQLTQLPAVEVRFSAAMDAASVENTLNWQVWSDGADISARIQDVTYTGDTALVAFAMPLRGESITLTALDGISDSLGRPLDGNGDAVAGGNFTLEFGIQQELYAVAPASRLYGVNNASGIRTAKLAISENGGFAIALIETLPNNLQYEGTAITTSTPDQYRPEFARTYLQIYDQDGARVGPLNYEQIGQVVDLQAPGADEYLQIGLMAGYYYQENHRYGPSGPLEWIGAKWFTTSAYNSASDTSATLFEHSTYRHEITLSEFDWGSHKDIAFHQNPSGKLVAAWASRQQGSGPYQVFAREYGPQYSGNLGPLGGPIRIDLANTDQSQPSVQVAADGSWTIIWSTMVGGVSRGIFARRFSADGVPLSGVIEVRSAAETIVSAPKIASDASGRTVIVWGEQHRVMASVLEGNTPRTPIGWAVGDERDVYQVFAALDAHGGLRVGWLQESPAGAAAPYAIYTQQFSLGHGATVDLNGAPTGDDFTSITLLNGIPTPAVDPGLTIRHETTQNLVSATLRIVATQPGDLLTFDTSGTSLAASYAEGVLTITGTGDLLEYERVLRTVTYISTADREAASFVEIGVSVNDGYFVGPESFARLQVYRPGSNRVVNRYVSYKGMYDERYSSLPSENADIPPNKEAYLPGSGPATFANITGFDRGINRIVVETYGRRGGITAADFSFRVGTSTDPDQWVAAPAPSKVTIGRSRTNPDRDRITIEWPDGAIKNTWLEVTLAANVRTGLAVPDVFYYGNKVGDTGEGNSAVLATTSAADVLAVRQMRRVYPYVTNPYDLNRDRKIDATDEALVRANLGVLRMLNLPAAGAVPALATGALPLAEVADGPRLSAVAAGLTVPMQVGSPASMATSAEPLAITAPARQTLDAVALAVVLDTVLDEEDLDALAEPAVGSTLGGNAQLSDDALLDALLGL